MTTFWTHNPATDTQLAEYRYVDRDALRTTLDRVTTQRAAWSSLTSAHRSELFYKLADLLIERSRDLALGITTEMGKPISESEAEVKKSAWVCRYYAEHADAMLEPVTASTDGSKSYVRYDPLGTVLAIMPWNFPVWQVFRQAAPAMMAGNTMVLKHAPSVAGTALAIEALFRDAGAPDFAFTNLFFEHDLTDFVVGHDAVSGVALTGSVGAGEVVASICGRHLKPCVMELGGCDPFLVLADAEVDRAIAAGVRSRCLNSGQSCIAAKRFIVEEPIFDPFVERFTDAMSRLQVGDPTRDETELGPMARRDLREALHAQVTASQSEGAELLLGGEIPAGDGFFYPPTVVLDRRGQTTMMREETFGPAAVITPCRDANHGLEIANRTNFGLGASLWTRDQQLAEHLAKSLDAGAVFVNGMTKSDPRLPFGGIKKSGFGRELGREGILAFVNTKTVWIA